MKNSMFVLTVIVFYGFFAACNNPMEGGDQSDGNRFIYPVQTPIRISAFFGWQKDPFTEVRRFHSAIDLAGNIGTPVMAAMSGTVSKTGYHQIYGNYIILYHGKGYETVYAHLSVLSVKQGDKVRQGDKLAEMGISGLSTGPHLHFSIFKNKIPVNPLDLL